MSPMEIWCNEAQERYVLAVDAARLDEFEAHLRARALPLRRGRRGHRRGGAAALGDEHFGDDPIDMPMGLLFGKPPRMLRDVARRRPSERFDAAASTWRRRHRVLRLPTVADKTFLITIGDRSVTGLVARDQMVGPWQVPVATAP
jgi:phosphoribosylformylglycinamidine synthase